MDIDSILESSEREARDIPEFLRGEEPQLCQCESCQSMAHPILTPRACEEVNQLFETIQGLLAKHRLRVMRQLDERERQAKSELADVFKRRAEILGVRA